MVALVEALDHVCCRYRLQAYESALCRQGWSLEYVPLARATFPRWSQLRRLHQADVVLLQRRLLPVWQLRVLRRHAACLIYDFDDAVFLRDSYSERELESRGRLRRFRAAVAQADLVIAGNRFLAVHAQRWTKAQRVVVVPTCVEPAQYPPSLHQRCGQGVELVWIGSRSTVQSFDRARRLLEEVGLQVPGLRLKVICDQFPELEHVEVIRRPWSQATEAAELAAADIGISWVPDDHWSRGKCGLKVLQYMAAGLPVVANPVGVHNVMVQHGRSGYLATTAAQWAEAIAALAHDPSRRRICGTLGRQWLQEHYSVERWSEPWVSLVHRVSENRAAEVAAS